ncbi:hypothetical protein QJ857_gp0619 [Tupanvirus soda lake]|uniref:Uncharacterized protein n=2 Tax=Tupanvirus TaxID=2094720 RepID=A0A6N1NLJ0_9VIRU|nr:hypothetical protein QJ857_gp0619 [Tupanvirus soda lake]QKU35424.1 hypothetical protein [Tupanvirus soda lake]
MENNEQHNYNLETIPINQQRSTFYYHKLEELRETHNITLSKLFTINSDADELEAEYKLQMHKINEEKVENIIDHITYLMLLFVYPYF